MSAQYHDIDELIDAVIANKVGIASLSNDLLADLLSRTVEIIADEDRPETTENINDLQHLLEKIAAVLEQRIDNDGADDVSKELASSVDRGNFCPNELNFTLH